MHNCHRTVSLVSASARQLKIKSRCLFKPSASSYTLKSTEVVIVIKESGWRRHGLRHVWRQAAMSDCSFLHPASFFPLSVPNSPTPTLSASESLKRRRRRRRKPLTIQPGVILRGVLLRLFLTSRRGRTAAENQVSSCIQGTWFKRTCNIFCTSKSLI